MDATEREQLATFNCQRLPPADKLSADGSRRLQSYCRSIQVLVCPGDIVRSKPVGLGGDGVPSVVVCIIYSQVCP